MNRYFRQTIVLLSKLPYRRSSQCKTSSKGVKRFNEYMDERAPKNESLQQDETPNIQNECEEKNEDSTQTEAEEQKEEANKDVEAPNYEAAIPFMVF